MKSFSVLLICALAWFSNACEKHPASELEGGHASSPAHAETAKQEQKQVESEKPGEPPKFFPEKK